MTSSFDVVGFIFLYIDLFSMIYNTHIAHGFFQKMAPKSSKIFITFSDTY